MNSKILDFVGEHFETAVCYRETDPYNDINSHYFKSRTEAEEFAKTNYKEIDQIHVFVIKHKNQDPIKPRKQSKHSDH